MSYFSIFILAFALSIDACVVSFSYGIVYENERIKNLLLLAVFTGAFQGLMPLISYFLVGFVREYIYVYADLIVFLIFSYLGGKCIIEAFQQNRKKELCIDLKCLLLIGIATSIDAFSAGITLSLYGNHILKPAILIALVTFINSGLGFFAGGSLKRFPTQNLEVFAGLLLFFIGIKALF